MTEIIQAPKGAPSALPAGRRERLVQAAPTSPSDPSEGGSGTVLPLLERESEPRRGPEVRRVNGMRISDLLAIVGAGLASLAVTATIFAQLAPVSGPIAFAAVFYVMFLVFYALLVAVEESAAVVRDRVVSAAIHTLAFVVVATLVFVVAFSVVRASKALPHWNLYTQDMSLTGPLDPLSSGGVLHAIAGSLIQISIALVITVPLGLTTALFLTEVPGPFARFVRTIVEAMTALPSIVAGLFIYASVILVLGVDKSGFAASLAISVMMLPIMIRSADVVLRLVPATLKEASIGLGAGQWQTVWRVVLPTSRSGLVTAIILATARGIGETSPVLLTSGFTAGLNLDPLHGPMISLPLAIFEFVKSPEPNMIARGFGAAAVLMFLVLALFVIARVIGAQTVASRERRAERIRRIGSLLGAGAARLATLTAPARSRASDLSERFIPTHPAPQEFPVFPVPPEKDPS
ncbi:phosphate ABC transporter permease PstA [Frondihabitans australicus]|uniref:Phosphate transport system permease protein PstA n=1 Tax=Frondihabitans australicus TaxID=386892 RepID=A0A495IAZ1_9MICO|nr:phosphate ABC transporter permease PstA [Frondihabitans australicus]RKR73164.1 phosphate ABC transporter membrane protein 2 (PhoT family) [Frondihabitans australicus]